MIYISKTPFPKNTSVGLYCSRFHEHYKFVDTDLNQQPVFGADSKITQKCNFIGTSDRAAGAKAP